MCYSQENSQLFATQVDDYKVSYWRDDEEELVNRYFVDRDARLLVLGCGAGRTLPHLHKKGYKIEAIDVVPEMVEAARQAVQGAAVKINVMDAANLDYDDNSFKYVFFPFHGIDYVFPDIYASVREVKRVLTKDGVFVFNSHNRLFIKRLHQVFSGSRANYRGLLTYRTSPLDYWLLKKHFHVVHVCQRISLLKSEHANWKDCIYKLLPWLNKSTYFVCIKPRNHAADK